MSLDRRSLLKLAVAAAIPQAWIAGCVTAQPRFESNPFALGVASGPSERGVVLWTRIAPDVQAQIKRMSNLELGSYLGARRGELARPTLDYDVRWEIADDESFRTIVRRGAAQAPAELGHSVHVEVDDLPPARWYWYRFLLGEAVSPVGRTRTPDAPDSARTQIRCALASCQHYETGHFGAYRHMRTDDPELVLFVGDYIYEGGPNLKRWRPHPFPSARTLFDYRLRHSLYRLDTDLQAMHAHCPWLVTWDDHEVSNDYARDSGEDPAVDGHARRLAGYQAYYENLPLPASTLIERFSNLRLYRSHRAATLASFIVLDDRQYRDRQACQPAGRGGSSMIEDTKCPQRREPQRRLLGDEQLAWLKQQFAQSGSRWNFIVQQTLFASLDHNPKVGRFWSDGWDGYPAERGRVLDAIAAGKPRNPVFLGGDVHVNWVCDVKRDFDDPRSAVIATEFCGTAISSLNNWDRKRADHVAALNPHVRFVDVEHRGYVLADANDKRLQVQLRVLDDARKPVPAVSTLARFEVEDGRPGARLIAG